MEYRDDWSSLLADHPIFTRKDRSNSTSDNTVLSLETLSAYTNADVRDTSTALSGRRSTMVIKDTELVVATGSEVRITSLKEAEIRKNAPKAYKTLHTPNVQFQIQQIALNPTEKLLAVAGTHELAVIVLPRPGYMRLVPDLVDCKSIQVGQYYHGDFESSPIVKIQWHPWGEAGSTLMVMTMDGKLREYDISVDTEEPAQVVSFGQDRRQSKSFQAQDPSEHEAASFTLGKGHADWGPLTVYAVMKSGDIYAICPYLPRNAIVPSAYLDALEYFVSAKQDYIAKHSSKETASLYVAYDYQRKYLSALLKQLPAGAVIPGSPHSVKLHPPTILKQKPLRQGPFLLQPSPRLLDISENNNATDIVYLSFGHELPRDEDSATESLGIILVASQDGKLDICLDVLKTEPRWEAQRAYDELPMLAVYETVDLGLGSLLLSEPSLSLLAANHPVILPDPIHEEAFYVYHSFGVHSVNLGNIVTSLGEALRQDDGSGESLAEELKQQACAEVRSMVTTFSAESRASNPVIAVAVPNDVYLTYSITILTSAMHVISFPLNVRLDSALHHEPKTSASDRSLDPNRFLQLLGSTAPYASLLGGMPYREADVFTRSPGPPVQPPSTSGQELRITPDTLRYLGNIVEQFMKQLREVHAAYREALVRNELQRQEYDRQARKLQEMQAHVELLKGARQRATEERMRHLREGHTHLLRRLDAVLQGSMRRANPDLSDHEKRWFEELKRMEIEVLGSGRQDPESLRARTSLLRREFDRLRPQLDVLKDKQQALTVSNRDAQSLGASQAFELGARSHKERAKIEKLQKELLAIAKGVSYPVSNPPSVRGSTPTT